MRERGSARVIQLGLPLPSRCSTRDSLVAYPTIPPIALIHPAISAMTPECARTKGRATPLTRNMEVTKWPKSTGPDEYSALKSSPTHREQMKLGRGARAKMRAGEERRVSGGCKAAESCRTLGPLTGEEGEPV